MQTLANTCLAPGLTLFDQMFTRPAADEGSAAIDSCFRVQRDSANATASAPAGIRTGHDGSFAARHTASATSSA